MFDIKHNTTTEALVIHQKGDLRLDTLPLAPPLEGQTLIRLAWGGICGSDMHYLMHGGVGASVLKEPMILGHEVSGFVEALGPGESRFQVGEAVAIHPARPCGHCPECMRGMRHLCRNMCFFGSAARYPHTDGGFRRHMVVQSTQLHALPAGLDVKAASMAEPFSVALHAIARAGDIRGKKVMVQGAGPIGSLIVAGLKVGGAQSIVATDLHDFALTIAHHLGATAVFNTSQAVHEDEYDIVFEATGASTALSNAIMRTQKGGTLIQVGMFPPGDVSAPLSQIIAREIDYRGTFRFDHEFENALHILANNPWIAAHLITRSFPLEQYSEAFALSMDRKKSSKVILEM
ncbi:L-idonate 5-dehydrogenase [Neokomagataea thailandica]|uniref:Zinc-dependent alcohol dehydrogenase n=1 Tax=Neokomagataea tanensis NBRC 106556 TaxID=1223519 RepID=A0ABQ0QI09_9PROT|nr:MULTISPECIES: L-idonate 5-dehydrogenase [Neokomagataea]GBR45499.1 zinc-dependent alcohol dehydrogenase [Neokomagataea tanensis NBRC 106556]